METHVWFSTNRFWAEPRRSLYYLTIKCTEEKTGWEFGFLRWLWIEEKRKRQTRPKTPTEEVLGHLESVIINVKVETRVASKDALKGAIKSFSRIVACWILDEETYIFQRNRSEISRTKNGFVVREYIHNDQSLKNVVGSSGIDFSMATNLNVPKKLCQQVHNFDH